MGILKYAQAHHSRVIQVKETWFEKLQDWKAALALYDRRLQYAQQHGGENQGLDIEVCIGKMRCLEALGKWEELSALATQVWSALRSPERNANRTSAPPSQAVRCLLVVLRPAVPLPVPAEAIRASYVVVAAATDRLHLWRQLEAPVFFWFSLPSWRRPWRRSDCAQARGDARRAR